MKGQSTLINEVLLFVIGIFIASFVAVSMDSLEERVSDISTTDHMKELSEFIIAGIVKTSESNGNSTLILKMKTYYGGETYHIRALGNTLIVSLLDDERISVTREIFNISVSKTIIGDVTSSSKYIMIQGNETTISIKKWQGNWS